MSNPVTWLDDCIPVSTRFDDSYFSRQGGREEVRHVFLAGNDLPARWRGRDRFSIAEFGFGTGLSFLETISAWRREAPCGARLDFVSFEQFPLGRDQIRRALAPWPDLSPLCAELCAALRCDAGWNRIDLGAIRLHLAVGDANRLIADWPGRADAWFLDGFSPSKNPELWNATLLRAAAERTAAQGSFATFTAAGWVRRNLRDAGFIVRKTPGFGRKREMTSGVLAPGRGEIRGPVETA